MANTKNNKGSKKRKSNENKPKSSQSLERTSGAESSRTGLSRREQFAPGTATPFTFMRRFSEEMDRLFEDFGFGRGLVAPTFESSLDRLGALGVEAWSPQVEVFERDKQLIVRADLPGMTREDINVDIEDGALIIRGERQNEREENDAGYYRSERSYGSVYRRIPLPQGVSAKDATADFRNGVLEIKMPVLQRADQQRRQLEIRSETQAAEQPQTRAKAAGQR